MIVVTSQQMMCATGKHFERLFRPGVFDPQTQTGRGVRLTVPDAQQLARLPLTNIVVASISEFEHLMGAVGAGELDLVPFLREVAASNSQPSTHVMFLEQILERKLTKTRLPRALKEAREEAQNILQALLP